MYLAYKFRLYPNKEQQILINKSLGCTRLVYNYYLDKMKKEGYQNFYSNVSDYVNNLKYLKPFLCEVDSTLIRRSIADLDRAYLNMFNNHFGYPKFKNRFMKNSYNTNAIYGKYKNKEYCNIILDLNNHKVKLPKLKWVDVRGYRRLKLLPGKIKSATISKESNGKYYVSLLIEANKEYPLIERPNEAIGIDLGIKKLLTLSDGRVFDNNKYILKYQKRIKRKQRELSRKEKGSKNYYKCKKELARIYSKLTNSRKYYLHKITKEITDEYDIITCEDLSSKEMIITGKKNHLSKSLTDASFNELIRQLRYKSLRKGKYFYQVDKYFPSSQICSRCSHKDISYKDLSKRKYHCLECGLEIDRDINASINIMFKGIKLYMKNLI